jgi:hypothetical protein
MMTPSIPPGWPDANLGPGDVQGPRYDFVLEPCGQHSRSIGRGASSSVPQGVRAPPPAKSAAGGVHRTDTRLYSPICQNGSILQPNPPITLDNPDRFRGSFL